MKSSTPEAYCADRVFQMQPAGFSLLGDDGGESSLPPPTSREFAHPLPGKIPSPVDPPPPPQPHFCPPPFHLSVKSSFLALVIAPG